MATTAPTTSARLAPCSCYRCREQKLKCSREIPICARCQRLGTECSYPDPPDRKKIARNRARPGRRKTTENGPTTSNSTGISIGNIDTDDTVVASKNHVPYVQLPPLELSPFIHTDINTLQQTEFDDSMLNGAVSEYDNLPIQIRQLFVEIYFTCIFNSSLVLHRGRFTQGQETAQTPNFVVLAVYALASNFLEPPCKLAIQHTQDIQALGNIASLGRQYAETAGAECLRNVDRPTLAHVQACLILALYWGSKGETSRNVVFSGIAYRTSRLLMMESSHEEQRDWLDREIQRRCFWAAFNMNCVNADHYVIGTSNDTLILQIPLPISEASFSHMIQEPQVTLTDFDGTKRPPGRGGEPNMWAEVLRLILQWTKIRDHIELAHRSRLKDPMVQFLELEDWMSEFLDNLDESLIYSREKLQHHANDRNTTSLFLLHSIFHQLRLVLHTSIVPQFSGRDVPNAISPSMITTSAQIVIASAQAISQLANDVLALGIEGSRLSPFTGHCMYVAACVHVSLLATDGMKRFQAWNDMVSACRVLKDMSPYWSILQGLWSKISTLFASQMNKLGSINSGQSTVSSKTSERDTAITKRSADGLPEPLAVSLLQFSLRKNKNGGSTDFDVSAARQLEDLLSTSASPVAPSNMMSSAGSISSPNMDYGIETEMSSLGYGATTNTTGVTFPYSMDSVKDWFQDLEALDPNILADIDFVADLGAL